MTVGQAYFKHSACQNGADGAFYFNFTVAAFLLVIVFIETLTLGGAIVIFRRARTILTATCGTRSIIGVTAVATGT